MTAKERTAWWIRHQPPSDRYSPSAPPSDRGELDDDAQSFTVFESDAESTHSVPPKMLLKYGDGRPDIPISHWHYERNREPLSHSGSQHRRSRSEQPAHRTVSRQLQPRDGVSLHSPEEIRVLPSRSNETPRPAPSQHRRSKSQPRHGYSPPEEPVPSLPIYPSQPTPYPHAPQVAYSQTHPVYQGNNPYVSRYSENLPGRTRAPPSIVYAPGPHSRGHYAPPTLIHHQHGTPAPRYNYSGGPFPATQRGLASVNENTKGGSQRGTRPARGAHFDDSRPPSRSSQNSGSTYYVLPTPGQKVQIIVSLYTTFYIFFVNRAVFRSDSR